MRLRVRRREERNLVSARCEIDAVIQGGVEKARIALLLRGWDPGGRADHLVGRAHLAQNAPEHRGKALNPQRSPRLASGLLERGRKKLRLLLKPRVRAIAFE